MVALGNEFTPLAAFEFKLCACWFLATAQETQGGKHSPRIEAKQQTINLKGLLTPSMEAPGGEHGQCPLSGGGRCSPTTERELNKSVISHRCHQTALFPLQVWTL